MAESLAPGYTTLGAVTDWQVSWRATTAFGMPSLVPTQLTQCPAEAAFHRCGVLIDVAPVQTEACF